MKKVFKTSKMHCQSCEIVLEEKNKKIKNVTMVEANSHKNTVRVEANKDVSRQVQAVIKEAGYDKEEHSPKVNLSKTIREYLLAGLIVFIFIASVQLLGIEGLVDVSKLSSSGVIAFVIIGLVAGFSSCMAITGGLVLGVSARHSEKHPEATLVQNFRPHLFFNLGRLFFFLILGGALAYFGSFFLIKPSFTGAMNIAVALVMIIIGLSLLSIFPKFYRKLTLSKKISNYIIGGKSSEYSHSRSFILGGLTFFLPCGFTQAAQIFAISTGSFAAGALVMFYFALGTTPGLLAIGGIASSSKKKSQASIFVKVAGIILIIFALQNLFYGLNLLNIGNFKLWPVRSEKPIEISAVKPEIIDGKQVLSAVYDPNSENWQYVINPKEFVAEVEKPVRIEVFSKEDGFGCMGSIALPGLSNEFKVFEKDKKTILEFTPKKIGNYKITCAMGVPMGTLEIVPIIDDR
jgi:uncharacterized protein